eukprot:11172335-Lingulodinium_polyedra.AAC.1
MCVNHGSSLCKRRNVGRCLDHCARLSALAAKDDLHSERFRIRLRRTPWLDNATPARAGAPGAASDNS